VSGVDDIAKFLRTEDVTLRVFQRSTDCAVSLLLPVGDPSVLKDVQLGTALVLLSAAVYCLFAFIKTFQPTKSTKDSIQGGLAAVVSGPHLRPQEIVRYKNGDM
jgi:hypothetical protein